MELITRSYHGNPIWAWALSLIIIIVSFILLRILKSFSVKKISAYAAKTESKLDDLIADLLDRTSWISLLVLAVYFGAITLQLPSQVARILKSITVITVLLQTALWGNGIISFWIERYSKQKLDVDLGSVTTIRSLGFLTKIGLWAVILLLALDNLGFEINALLAGLGIGGIAVALAAQNILGDLFASLSIVLDKPFVIGDLIIVGEHQGFVEHIGLKTTRIRSLFGEQIIISNNDLLKSRIRNFKRMEQRRVVFSIGVVYQTSNEKLLRVSKIIQEIVEKQEGARFDRAHLRNFASSSLDFEVVYWVLSADYVQYMDVQQAINLEILRSFRDEGIEFAYPTQTLFIDRAA